MPFTLQETDGVLRVTIHGAAPVAELHDLLTAIETFIKARSHWPDSLVDLRGIDLAKLGLTDLLGLAKRREALTPPNAFRTAMIADSPTVLGFARMFQSVNHNPAITLELFQTLEAAEAWLAGC
jgi:hypothetical protein